MVYSIFCCTFFISLYSLIWYFCARTVFLYYTSISASSLTAYSHLPFLPDITHSFLLTFIHSFFCPTSVPNIPLHIPLLFASLRIEQFHLVRIVLVCETLDIPCI